MPPWPRLRRLDRLNESRVTYKSRRNRRNRVRVNKKTENGVDLSLADQLNQLLHGAHEVARTAPSNAVTVTRLIQLIRDRPHLDRQATSISTFGGLCNQSPAHGHHLGVRQSQDR